MNPDTLENEIGEILRKVPRTWTEFDITALSELQEKALYLLTSAGMIERRITLRFRIFGHPVAVEATITVTGEGGFAEAMEYVLSDMWNDWREVFESRHKSDAKDAPGSHCERIGKEQWRLTAAGIDAKNDLETGRQSTVINFVMKKGIFDGQPRFLPNGKVSQRLPVVGVGKLERMSRVSANTSPAEVNIANWEAGGKFFAAAFAEVLKAKESYIAAPKTPTGDVVKKPKKSTERGEGRAKIIAALTKHHQYAEGSCLNLEPIGNNDLAKLAGVSPSTASTFFNEKFDGHSKYKTLCRDTGQLIAAMKLLNNEFAPNDLYGRRPAAEDDRDDE